MNLLIIDDDIALQRSFSNVLERSGFRVTSVASEEAAMEALRAGSFDVILCDIILPGTEGTTVYEHLSREYPELEARFVFITGSMGDEKVRRLVEHTGRPCLEKPVELKELVATVQVIATQSSGRSST